MGLKGDIMTELETILNLLQEAEARSFYDYTSETDRFRKGRKKVINGKIRETIEELAREIEKEKKA